MKFRDLVLCACAALLPALAGAQEAHSTKWINLRAGPARDYPLVASYGPGTPLLVQGCTDGYGWCDVLGPGEARGWVYAGNIAYPYESQDVPVLSYGPQLGFPIVVFSIGNYWGQYYRNRPWYGNQGRWINHRPPPRPIFRPPGRPGPIGRPPGDHRPPIGRPPGGRPPGMGDGRPPGPGGGRPPGAGGGRPPGEGGGRPPGAGGGRPPGEGGGRPPGAGGGRPPGAGGGRPPGDGGGRPPGGGGRPGGGEGRPGGGEGRPGGERR